MRTAGVRRLSVMVALGASVLLAGCGGVETLSFHKPPPTTAPRTTSPLTLPGDLASVRQTPVPGATTTTLPKIGPGNASITGSVFGPGGPVAGATVEVVRLVGNQLASANATTAADGSFTIGNILGGRYRVRAWHSPDLSMTAPQMFFLEGGQPHNVTLRLVGFSGPDIATSVNPSVLYLGDVANLLVQATTPAVGPDGVVRYQPVVGTTVTLTNGPNWTVYNSNPQTTGTNGRVLFQIGCSQTGDNPLSVTVGSGNPQTVPTPACVQPAPPTTTCVSSTSSTTTLIRPGETTTTQQPCTTA